jgi:hypothetical protein
MESKKINQLATELAPDLSDLTIIGDPTTGISKKITLSQMASLFTGTVEEYANLAAFPLVGVADTIYIALDTNVIYRWDSTDYVVLSPNVIASLVFNDANGFDGTIALVGSVATLTITTALTSGSVPFIGASGALTQDNANLFFDDTNNRLGINTNAPTTSLDIFGSGIIGRINGTSTNNAYLGFASAGTNKWSVGNVQSDHRFRIFSEANSAELVSVLQTGEFGIGIANPTTKFHIDGAASALIANLDANVSVAKSVSFRSDNSNRINLEVSGTESGSNAGADFFLRTFTDAGSLLATPLTITRSTGAITLATALSGTSASFSSTATASAFIPSGATIPTNGMYLSAANTLNFATNTTNRFTISSTGAATFSGDLTVDTNTLFVDSTNNKVGIGTTTPGQYLELYVPDGNGLRLKNAGSADKRWDFALSGNDLRINEVGVTAVMAFKAGGNVGINTVSPSKLLHLYNTAANDVMFIESTQVFSTIAFKSSTNSSTVTIGIDGAGNAAFENKLTTGAMAFVTNGSERMRIESNGRLGIGISGPAFLLDVGGGVNGVTQNVCRIGNTSGYTNGLTVSKDVSNIYTFNFGDNSILQSSYTYGNTVTSPRTVYVNSSGVFGGISSILASKTNIKKFDTKWLFDLKPVQFNYRKKDESEQYTDEFDTELFYGLIAEETELINKEICTYNDEKLIGIEYSKLVPVLVKAIQELKGEIDILKAK